MNGRFGISIGAAGSRRMTERQNLLRRRTVLKATGAAGLLGATGMTLNGAAAQEQNQAEQRTYSYSLQEGDVFRVRLRPHDPWGNPATETVPAACLGGEEDEEFQMFIVESYRDEEFIGYRSLLAPVERLAPEVLEPTQETETTDGVTETETETETTEAALQDETTEDETPTDDEDEADDEDEETTVAADEETTTVAADELPEIQLGQWYRVASSEECDGLYRLLLETTEEPETDEGPATTAVGDETETTTVEDETVETETEDEGEDTD